MQLATLNELHDEKLLFKLHFKYVNFIHKRNLKQNKNIKTEKKYELTEI